MQQVPTSVLLNLFPPARREDIGRGGGEVNGLSSGTEPQNCKHLLKGVHVMHHCGVQTHFLVEAGEQLIWLRVCQAMKGSPYAEFAVILDAVDTADEKEAARLTASARRYIESFCSEASLQA